MYAELDDAGRAAKWARWALANEYGDGPDGLPGNDDGGTMSAWYVFASLGLYAMAGDDDYVIGSPLWTRAELHLPGGDLVIEAPDAAPGVMYVRELTWDGADTPRDRIEHATIATGGTLRFGLAP